MTARAGLRRPRPMVPQPRLSLQRGYSQAAAAQRLKFCLSQKLTEFRLRVSQFRLSQPWPLASARLRVSFSGAPLAAVLPAATECVDSLCIPSSTKHHNVMQCNQHMSDVLHTIKCITHNCSGVWYPRLRPCGLAIYTSVDLIYWLGKPKF